MSRTLRGISRAWLLRWGDHRAFDGHVRRALAATDRRGAHAAKGRALVCRRRRRRRRRMRRDERNASLCVRVQFAGRLGSAAAIVSSPYLPAATSHT